MPDILTLGKEGKADDVMRDIRVRSLWSPYYFTRVCLGYHDLVPHLHQQEMDLFIVNCEQGVRKHWIEWPRGFFKTTCFTVGCAMWFNLPFTDEDSRYAIDVLGIDEGAWLKRMELHSQDWLNLLAFETFANAKKKVAIIRHHFESTGIFRAAFSEIAYTGSPEERPWNNEGIRIRRRDGTARAAQEGSFDAIGAGNALQSRHYDKVFEDDLVGKAAVESRTEMEKIIRWHGLLHGAFVRAETQFRVAVSNKWGFNDLNAHVKNSEKDFLFYTKRAIDFNDKGDEVAIFPERMSLAALAAIRDDGSMSRHDFNCQYMNIANPEGETLFSIDQIPRYRVDPDGLIHHPNGKTYHSSDMMRYMHYDPYNAKATSTSLPAIIVIGLSGDRNIFVLDYVCYRENHSQIFDRIFEMNKNWRPNVFTYEDVGAQNLTAVVIRERLNNPKFAKEYGCEFAAMRPSKTGNRAMEVRINAGLVPLFNSGRVAIRNTHTALLSQLETFPANVFDHDYDILDAMEDGVALWHYPFDQEAELRESDENVTIQQCLPDYSSHTLRLQA